MPPLPPPHRGCYFATSRAILRFRSSAIRIGYSERYEDCAEIRDLALELPTGTGQDAHRSADRRVASSRARERVLYLCPTSSSPTRLVLWLIATASTRKAPLAPGVRGLGEWQASQSRSARTRRCSITTQGSPRLRRWCSTTHTPQTTTSPVTGALLSIRTICPRRTTLCTRW